MTTPKTDFDWLLRDARQAFRRKDCYGAREVTRELLVKARTAKQSETVYRLQNAVRKCISKHDLGQTGRAGASCKKLPSKNVSIEHIPKGTPIVDCGRAYVAHLASGPAVVVWAGSHGIMSQSRLRRAAVRGTFAGTKRRRRRRK